MSCVKPLWVVIKKTGQGILAPCGKCGPCKSIRSQVWAARLSHEAQYHKYSWFLTLTYNDECLPPRGTLIKKDLQNFIKRVRSRCSGFKTKYFACGEYGERLSRPHYHLIFFSDINIPDDIFADSWPFGFLKTGSCCIESMRYVVGYTRKKLVSCHDSAYTDVGLLPPFQLQSLGLGLQWARDNSASIRTNNSIHLDGLTLPVPRLYNEKLGIDKGLLQYLADESCREELKRLIEVHKDQFRPEEIISILSDPNPRRFLFMLKGELEIYNNAARRDLHLSIENHLKRSKESKL